LEETYPLKIVHGPEKQAKIHPTRRNVKPCQGMPILLLFAVILILRKNTKKTIIPTGSWKNHNAERTTAFDP
jgi:hypothetical protein